jgi:hypothetical protein
MPDVDTLLRALATKSKFELVEKTVSERQVRLVGRIPEDSLKQNMNNWLLVVKTVLVAQERQQVPWSIDFSKYYFLKGETGNEKVVYGHRVLIQSKDIPAALESITKLVIGSRQTAAAEVSSFPLPGVNGTRNDVGDGTRRGAATIKGG